MNLTPDQMSTLRRQIYDRATQAERRRTFDLVSAVIGLLNVSGLPDHCINDPSEIGWIGTPDQKKSLAELHKQLCAYLPPMPEEE